MVKSQYYRKIRWRELKFCTTKSNQLFWRMKNPTFSRFICTEICNWMTSRSRNIWNEIGKIWKFSELFFWKCKNIQLNLKNIGAKIEFVIVRGFFYKRLRDREKKIYVREFILRTIFSKQTRPKQKFWTSWLHF